VRVVIDTNVLVSGVINPHGPPGRIVDAVLARTVTMLYDDRILGEYRIVLSRPRFKFAPADVNAFLDLIELKGEATMAGPLALELPDASDLPFFEVAASGRADALVTGNIKHFKVREISEYAHICTPAEFVRLLEQGET
jgi:uncharacterized protein